MARATPDASDENDPLAEGPRIDWGTAARTFLQIAILIPLLVVVFAAPSDQVWPVVPALLIFLLLRVPGELAGIFAGRSPGGLATEGILKAAAWTVVPHAVRYAFTEDLILGPLWLIGIALTLLGFSLWGHHTRALSHAPRLARTLGATGALTMPLGLAALSTLAQPPAPWHLLLPGLILVVGGAIALRTILRLNQRAARREVPSGWTGWYQSHFFRLTVLLAAVAVYMVLRPELTGVVPFLFLFEYGFAVAVAAAFLWSLRAYAHKQVQDAVIVGPHGRHEQDVERLGEEPFDRLEAALGQFLDRGDPDELLGTVRDLERDGVPTDRAWNDLLAHRSPSGVLLVHPAWLYASRLSAVIILTWMTVAAFPQEVAGDLGLLVFALGCYSAQWNRYGGPWAVKTTLGLLGSVLLLRFLARVDLIDVLGTAPGLILATLALALALVHPWRARQDRPTPRFRYHGKEPLDAIQQLGARYDRSILLRAAWLGAIGIVVFYLISELSKVFPTTQAVFTVYLGLAFAFILYPVFVAVGLRVGRIAVQRRHDEARRQRETLLQRAHAEMARLLEAPDRSGPGRSSDR